MDFFQSTRRVPLWLSLGFPALALFVFSWGLGYKLSLYDPPQSMARLMPSAKLLSKNEQSIGRQSALTADFDTRPVQLHSTWPGVAAILPLAALLLWIAAPVRRLHRPAWVSRIYRRAGLAGFFFRPPPILS